MPFKIDYVDGDVLTWSLTDDGATCDRDAAYAPAVYASADSRAALDGLRGTLDGHPDVVSAGIERRRTGFRRDPEDVLRIELAGLDAVRAVAASISAAGVPGDCRAYDVDLSREFRYCLDAGVSPVPERELRTLELTVSERTLAGGGLSAATVGGEDVAGDPPTVAAELAARVAEADPDVLVVNTAEVVPAFYEAAAAGGLDVHLGRRPGWQRLAGASTYESYGRVGHSPARYNVPGRVLIDCANAFFWEQTNLDGCLYLIGRSHEPLQELARSSIGRVLTAIQIREARERDVLVPWHSRRHERFKTMRQLHAADRGGFTFAPEVGLHEGVHELDFSSLYPNVIVTRNVSPETVRCDCHAGRADVPGLDYAVCDDPGYLPDVLAPLIADREESKAELSDAEDPARRAALTGKSSAIKWILVACFGYQGFSNAKFGRIECHEAINAFAREILLDAKEALEAAGWRVVHGIVDSLWVTAESADPTPLPAVCERVTADVGIRLEYEAAYDWVAFVPRRGDDAGALTKYFGRVAGERGANEDAYKYRGIECRQRSTPPFVADAQRDLIAALDAHRGPEPVCERLRAWLGRLRRGDVDPAALRITTRASKRADEYDRHTRTVAALERAAHQGLAREPGQDVAYVVADDSKRSIDRVRLADEEIDRYDAEFYRERLLRAAESVLSPLGWRRGEIESHLDDRRDASLAAYT
ncbi:MAG: type B DNA-directed DNA polymerase [Salinigranum sp.]